MKNKKFNSLITLSLTILLAIVVLRDSNFFYYENFYIAQKQSLTKNKPLLIYFYSEKEKLNLKEIEKDYIICFLNYEKNKNIFEKFKLEKLPSYVIINNETKEICKIEGEQSKQSILRWLINLRKNTNTELNQ